MASLRLHSLPAIAVLLASPPGVPAPCLANGRKPPGLMLNLDFQQIEEGLVPSKALYPLHVPLGELGVETFGGRNLLAFQPGQGLDIPHSSLLDPGGREWIVSVRVFALSNGLVLSQGGAEHGYAIYLKDGAVHATIRTAHSAVTLKEREDRGITDCIKRWTTIELRIAPDRAVLSLNRRRVAMAPLQAPLRGDGLYIRLGEHRERPAVLQNVPGSDPAGFTGAIASLKMLRQ